MQRDERERENQQWEAIVFGLQQGQLFALSARRSASRSLALWENSLKLHDPAADAILYMCTAIEWKILRHSVH
jgi:hypothetical protein